jgi:molybdate transport system permease protein
MVLCWARAIGELGATLIFAGNLQGETQTMPLAIIQAFEGTSLGLAGAVALSLMLLVAALIALVGFRLILGRSVALR